MDRKLIAICFLTITAIALMIANFVTPSARADVSVSGGDYQAVTARITGGGDALYIMDNRTGLVAVVTYDLSSHTLISRTVRSTPDFFK